MGIGEFDFMSFWARNFLIERLDNRSTPGGFD
jgi:hypothetical protein